MRDVPAHWLRFFEFTGDVADVGAAAMLDAQTGERGGGFGRRGSEANAGDEQGLFGIRATGEIVGYGDSGGASRFFGVFDYQEDPWTTDHARSAGESSGPSDAPTGSVDGPAQDERLHEHGASSPPSNASAGSAGASSSITRATGRDTTAPTPVGRPQSGPSDPSASDAADPSGSCATGSAPSNARPSPSSACDLPEPHGRPSGQQPNAPTPYRFRASTVESPDGTGITSSTTIPPSSCGSASPATPLDTLDADGHGPTRFRYEPKSSSAERNAGLDGFEAQDARTMDGGHYVSEGRTAPKVGGPRANVHPTVKPIDLMRWLVRLVTPPGGLILDPFTGSGTTGAAAMLEGFRFVGIEREPEYAAIARARIAWWAEHPDGVEIVKALEAERTRTKVRESGQESLFG